MRRRAALLTLLIGFISCLAPSRGEAQEKLRLLIIDGQNNHNWAAMTPVMKQALKASKRFTVEVATTPPAKSSEAAWVSFRPDFSQFHVVLSNYNGEMWPAEVRQALETYVHNGGGLVNIHAANNAFAGWEAFNKMIGLGWRNAQFGDRVSLDDDGNIVRTPKGAGPGSGHGPVHEFAIKVRDAEHPVMSGMPRVWMHAKDELYHGQRGPAEGMRILASTFSAKEKGGTGEHEPMIWWIPFGKGRVLTTVMGHVMGNDTTAIRCVGFQAVMTRGCEWAATGKVTIALSGDFPGVDRVSLATSNE